MPAKRPQADHYAVLGVPSSASAQEITSAYRRQVRALHPDTAPGDPAAGRDFAAVLAAYNTLRDPVRRAAYDAGRDNVTARPSAAGRRIPVRVTRTRSAPPPGPPSGCRRIRRPGCST
ncbi:J domain-containing protein [Streptomyces mexicanus]|uniref:J domain-containing protein n=1 Tax=Streptomyces mexicanus TaxID=178566 RepID=A0A7X1I4D2_9ACTN|nr:J domain-containing protein [Streptomyces mexicanus]MBC2868579.1 J domain-containing protein [Streptomyces mexicanus]